MLRKIPAIVSDIDGVLVRGKEIIPGSNLVLNYVLNRKFILKENNNNNKIQPFKIPFLCLTNGGGLLEVQKAEQLNQIFKDYQIKLQKENIILNYTPLRKVLNDHKNKYTLLCGSGKINQIAEDCGLYKYITIDEYTELYNNQQLSSISQILQNRFGIKNFDSDFLKQQIEAIFILHDPIKWEESLHAIIELCKMKNIPIYVVNNDISYQDQFHLPRLAFGPFTYVLKEIYQRQTQKELQIIYYGKPTKNTYDYTQIHLNNFTKEIIGNIYMIGDNPKSDIRGANNAGWKSILVKTGVFKGEINDQDDPAQYVVDNMLQAFEFICHNESLQMI